MASSVVKWESRCEWNTGISADSVEWCPVCPFTGVLVCGTYHLTEQDGAAKNQRRIGRIYLFKVDQEPTSISPIQTIDTSGILDQKWSPTRINEKILLGAVTSDGMLQLYQLIEDEIIKLELYSELRIVENGLALSLDWSWMENGEDARVVVSDSLGSVTVVEVREKLAVMGVWKGHDYEAWIGAFDYRKRDIFYSGGDDGLFKSYDLRVRDVPMCTSRAHDAGVTAIRSSCQLDNALITGSYDEKVRLWDSRKIKVPVNEINVNGGVWRLKYHPKKPNLAVAACMYGGFRIIDLSNGQLSILCENLEHKSIAYGADWRHSDGVSCIASCSFYDCKLCLSYIDL